MNDYWTAAVSRLEHDERIRRARWDSWATEIIRRRRADRRARRAERRTARERAIARTVHGRGAEPVDGRPAAG